MSAGKLNITIEQGATFNRDFTYTDQYGTPINITGATIRMNIKENFEDSTAILSATTGSDGRISLTNATKGKFNLKISAADTADLSFDQAYYQIEIEFTDGQVDRILEGRTRLSKEIVR